MEQSGEATQGGKPPGAAGAPARPVGSGEGARSALEQLIQQQRRREAQLPRDDGAPAPAARS